MAAAQVSAVKGFLAEARSGLKRIEAEVMVATGVQACPGREAGNAAADAARHQDFGRMMAAFHESAAATLKDSEARTSTACGGQGHVRVTWRISAHSQHGCCSILLRRHHGLRTSFEGKRCEWHVCHLNRMSCGHQLQSCWL